MISKVLSLFNDLKNGKATMRRCEQKYLDIGIPIPNEKPEISMSIDGCIKFVAQVMTNLNQDFTSLKMIFLFQAKNNFVNIVKDINSLFVENIKLHDNSKKMIDWCRKTETMDRMRVAYHKLLGHFENCVKNKKSVDTRLVLRDLEEFVFYEK